MSILPRMGSILFAVVLVASGLTLFADHAFAQGMGTVGDYSCSNGQATGQLFNSGSSCPTTLNMDNLFSFLVCNMEQLSSNLMGSMYCGMINTLTPAVWAAATLSVTLFGAGLLVGVIPATGRDAVTFLLKIAFVTAFATNADIIINYGYALLIGGVQDGVATALGGIGGAYANGAQVYEHLDGFLNTAFHMATDGMNGTTGPETCKNAIFAVMATMSLAFPMITYLGLLLLARIALTFLRAVFGYIYAIVGITFLLTLSPFFVTFYLFQVTRSFFEKWLGYLISFTLQMVILFSFIAFIFMLDVSSLVSNVSNIIVYNEETHEGTARRMPWQYCTLCDFKVVDGSTCTRTAPTPGHPSQCALDSPEITSSSPNYLTRGELICKTDPPLPIKILFAAAPPTTPTPGQNPTTNTLIEFACQGIMSLLLLAFVVERVLKLLPSLAQKLASSMASYAPQLGGGYNPMGVSVVQMPGEGQISDFAEGYNRGVNREQNRNGLSTTAQGIKDGLSAMTTGRLSGKPNTKGSNDGEELGVNVNGGQIRPVGVQRRFLNFMADPNKWNDPSDR
ncbi:MAG: type IV secretion system protein [Pseudomonadota bacterium]